MSSDSFRHDPLLAVTVPATERGTNADLTNTLQSQVHSLEAQLLSAQRLEMLGLLSAGIAHDFNNLITAVLGYTELARAALPADSLPAMHCEQAAKGLRRAAELARQLMAYAGRAKLKISSVNLSNTISELEGMLHALIAGYGSVSHDLDSSLPEIAADRVQMSQLVMNLVGNAAEALHEQRGTVTIRTRSQECGTEVFHGCRPTEQLIPGRYVILEVSDTGSGIPAELQSRLFDPFFSTKGKQRGDRGLGLSIVQGIVVRHHGTIRVESEFGRGTTFTVYLPTFGAPDPIVMG